MATNYNKDHHNATPHYNGNISALTTDYLRTEITPLAKFFRYDKLNRIKGMKTNTNVGDPQCLPFFAYSTYYTYDYNGNLDTLIRYDNETNELHYIEYEYLSGNNRLDSITAWWGLNTGGYRYDAIGNLIRDNGEGLDISWNAAGKVDTIWKNGNVLSTFRYSATGQRQMKKTGDTTDYYIHDASGNVMCIYRGTSNSFKAVERPIYGAKRLGELRQEINLTTPANPSIPPFTIGMRQYELTDHLGNVMVTILDRRQPYSSGDNTYKPYTISSTDYYPFGYPIPNRSTNIGGYRYFFNGQEGDNEVLGEVANFTAEFWQYDSRLGRRWNLDWIYKPFASNYAAFANNPVWFADPSGLDTISMNKHGDITDRVETSNKEHVVILPEIDVKSTPTESSGSVEKNNNPSRKNPYKPGSLPYIVYNNNLDNPNLWYQKSNFQWSNTTKSPWMRDFDRSFGTVLLAGMTPTYTPLIEPIVADAVVSIPELASMTAQGARQVFRLAKHGGKLALTKGYGIYITATTDEVFLTNIQFAYYVMGIPYVQTIGGFVIGSVTEILSWNLPPDLTTNHFYFDFGLQSGTLFGKEVKKLWYDY